jgi:sarcosine oxidase subunit beta
MRAHADAVIIGGGIIGFSVAFHLAKKKFGNIVLLEKEAMIGEGSTSKAAGGIRAQFAQRVNVEMSMVSEAFFKNFKQETGSEASFEQVGYLFLVQNEDDVKTFIKSHDLHRELGLPAELLEPKDILKVAPHISIDGVKLGTFCHEDGIADPWELLLGFEKAARRLGVEVELEAELIGIDTIAGEITTAETKRGNIKTQLVVNCAGAYSRKIGEMAAAKVEVDPYKRQIVTTGELDFVKPAFPMVVDVTSGLYSHNESKGLLLGWADKSRGPSFDVSVDPEYTDAILERALQRIPQLETAEIANQWAGLYESTPDHLSIIGWAPEVKGMFHCCGFSGHGVMHAPAAGKVSAEMICGKKPSIDISSLAPERFAKGQFVEETNVI